MNNSRKALTIASVVFVPVLLLATTALVTAIPAAAATIQVENLRTGEIEAYLEDNVEKLFAQSTRLVQGAVVVRGKVEGSANEMEKVSSD